MSVFPCPLRTAARAGRLSTAHPAASASPGQANDARAQLVVQAITHADDLFARAHVTSSLVAQRRRARLEVAGSGTADCDEHETGAEDHHEPRPLRVKGGRDGQRPAADQGSQETSWRRPVRPLLGALKVGIERRSMWLKAP